MDELGEHFTKEYTTNEKPYGNWIDGSVIYAKTISTGALSDGINNIPHNISNLRQIVKLEGVLRFSDGSTIPLGYFNGTSLIMYVSGGADATNVVVVSNVGNIASGEITVYYTKTETS